MGNLIIDVKWDILVIDKKKIRVKKEYIKERMKKVPYTLSVS